jgi:DNA mismatch repair protein MutH
MEAPATEAELMRRAGALAGKQLGQLANDVPTEQLHAKGWIGRFIEDLLGATAGNRPVPDFEHLGIELKTLPVSDRGKPRETTYVCTCPLDGNLSGSWETSRVRHKLGRVLWVPIIGGGTVASRVVASPLLWSASPEEEALLRADWELIADMIRRGEHSELTGHIGEALQLRPKAANAAQLTWALDDEGEWAKVQPRGFYLRTSFTYGLMRKYYAL